MANRSKYWPNLNKLELLVEFNYIWFNNFTL
jgi:hypothetical protein